MGALALAKDDAASGWQHARVGAGQPVGSDRDHGRRDQRALADVLRRRGRDRLESSRGMRGHGSAGLFLSLYTDRGSHYWHTPEAGVKVDRHHHTQFGLAMQQLGIEMITALAGDN